MSVDSLMGVDYTSSALNITDYHATEINNFLKKNNVLQKRNGYLQISEYEFNGIWECNYKGAKIIIAHIGSDFYRVMDLDKFDNSDNNYIQLTNVEGDTSTKINGINDSPSFAVFANDRLYILCGTYIVLKFTTNDSNQVVIKPYKVYDDDDTYIPTVIKGVTFSTNDLVNQRSLDDINLMSSKIIIGMTSLASANIEAKYNDYTTQVSRIYNFPYKAKHNSIFQYNFELSIIIQDSKGTTKELQLYQERQETGEVYLYAIASSLGKCTPPTNGFAKKTINGVETNVLYIGDINDNALGLLYDFLPPTSDDNIIVKYSDDRNNESTLIDKCTFGIMYGAGGNRNRLFVAGNPDKPNVDYHTSRRNIYSSNKDVDLQDSQDLTYFSVNDYCAYGTSNTKITDYQIMGDGSLIVLKEKSVNEPSVYFRGALFNKIALNDSYETYQESYPLSVGNIGEGALPNTYGTLKNLNNDIVFLSENGLMGVSATITASALASDYKYAYNRSRLINVKFLQLLNSKSNKIAVALYDNKYFVTITQYTSEGDDIYTTFVADGRHTYKLKDSVDNEYEYEWFVLDGIYADRYFVINNMLYFNGGEGHGGLYKLDLNNTQYQDIKQIDVIAGDLSQIANSIYLNGYILQDLDGDKNELTISNDVYLYNLENPMPSSSNGSFINLNKFYLDYFRDPTNKIYLATKDTSGNIDETIEIYVEMIEDSSYQYQAYFKEDNTKINNLSLYDMVLFSAKDHKFTIVDDTSTGIKKDYCQDIYGNIVTFIETTKDETTNVVELYGVFKKYYNIKCKYMTKAYNMGQSLYAKYLRSITIINDSGLQSWVNFGIYTKNQATRFEGEYNPNQNGLVTTYKDLFQADLTASSFATSFTKNYTLRFNFIQFEFWNEDEHNCVINNLSVIYTYGFRTKGANY